jgi:glycerate-2-kinase
MKIRNADALSTSELRRMALSIAEAGLEAVETPRVIRENVRLSGETLTIDGETVVLHSQGRLFVIGVGKCSRAAVSTLAEILGERLSQGIALDVEDGDVPQRVRVLKGTHPFPSQENVAHTRKILDLLEATTGNDIVIFVISGGGSVLLCQPPEDRWQDEAAAIKALFRAGATIEEINTFRKHFSRGRGGFLAHAAHPARIFSLIFSDVPGDDVGFIASGPTVKDETTVTDAQRILATYAITGDQGNDLSDALIETPKDKEIFERATTLLLVSNMRALASMQAKAQELGFAARVVTAQLRGEAREIGRELAGTIGQEQPHTALLYGGETTVTIEGDGQGGRNQELVLGALPFIAEGMLIASCASDGWDNTDHAGALGDMQTKERSREANLDPEAYLARNASYDFFTHVGDYLETGRLESNVADLIFALRE